MLSSCSSALPCPYLPMRCKVSFQRTFPSLVFLLHFSPRLSGSLGTNPTPHLPQGLCVWCLFLRHREERDLDSLCPTPGHWAFPSPPPVPLAPSCSLLSNLLVAQLHTLSSGSNPHHADQTLHQGLFRLLSIFYLFIYSLFT